LRTKGIASCPTVLKAVREHGNASDKFLQVVETVDLAAVLAQILDPPDGFTPDFCRFFTFRKWLRMRQHLPVLLLTRRRYRLVIPGPK
ncbi:MAG: hypothetical protein ACFNKE_03415, partial [Neisseria elongata]